MRRAFFFLTLACSASGWAQLITNGGFEAGNLSGWTTGGTNRVGVIAATGVTPNIPPYEGTYFAVLSTGPGSTGGALTSLDGYGGSNEDDLATLSTSFTVTTAPVSLSFAFAFLTSEQNWDPQYDDLFDVTLRREATPASTGFPLVRGSVLKPVTGNSPWSDFGPYDGVSYTFTSGGPITNTVVDDGRTAWTKVCVTVDLPGTYTLQFRVADQGDAFYDSALLVDAVEVPSTCALASSQLTSTSGAVTEWKGGSLQYTPVDSREPALADSPPVMAFVSSGNITGDNPGAQEQIFVHDGLSYQRLTSATSGSFSHPALTANGRFVAFASTANLTGQNADGNWEIFRVDRQTLATTQITNTSPPCENRAPSIAGDAAGDVIAFTTTCSLPGFANPDGNVELVAWDGASFAGTSTSGCQNYAPAVARQQSRYVAFISTCNLSGTNADGNPEVFRWDRQTNSFLQITNTADPVAQDVPSIASSGSAVLFASNGNFAGSNADGSYELFKWQSPATITQVSNEPNTVAYISGKLDDAGVWAVGERLDFTTFSFETRVFYMSSLGNGNPVFSATDPLLPTIAAGANIRRIALQSQSNLTGGNPDGNVEVFEVTTSGAYRRILCAQPDTAIPDNNVNGVTDTIASALTGTVADLDLWVQITHTRVSDLQVQLTSPAGTTVLLVDRPGLPGAGCNGDNVDAVLDDEATQPAETQCLNLPALSGYLVPNNPLSSFDGQNASGNWTLRVSDQAKKENGTLQRWCLAFQLN